MDFTVTGDYRVKIKERKKDNQIVGSFQRIKKAMEHESDCDANYN